MLKNNIDNKKQQIENDRLQEVLIDQAKPKCSICGKYTDNKTSPQCFGHGGGGGGSDSKESGKTAEKDDATIQTKSPNAVDTVNEIKEISAIESALMPQLELNDIKFNPEVISDLLSKKILVIDNDKETGMLTIKLQYDANSLSLEQRNELKKFANAILNELNEFRKEHSISAACYTIQKDKDDNIVSLRIALPTPTFYDTFIQRLATKYLLPVQNIEQQKNQKVAYPENMNHFNLTPFSLKPAPGNKKLNEEELEKIMQKKFSIRPKSPLDGLKPKGLG